MHQKLLCKLLFSVLIQPKSCDNARLAISIPSRLSDFSLRSEIRATFGDVRFYSEFGAKRIFLLALGRNMAQSDLKKVLKESEKFDDIILGDFHDSALNLTLKAVMNYRWLYHHCKLDFGYVMNNMSLTPSLRGSKMSVDYGNGAIFYHDI